MAESSQSLLLLSVFCFFFSFSSLSRPYRSLGNILTPEAVTGEEVAFSDWVDVDQVSPSASGGADTQVICQEVGAGRHVKSEELLPPLLPGGNAGIAAAYSARKLGIPVTIVLPENTSMQVVRRLEGEGAEVQLAGKVRRKWKARAEWWGRGAVSSPTAPQGTASAYFGQTLARTSVLVFGLLSGGWREERMDTLRAGTSGRLVPSREDPCQRAGE